MAGCKYDIALDPGAEGTSHALLLELVGFAKDVLDVGCATGYLAGALAEQGCRVWGVEVDADAARTAAEVCEQVVVGDLAALDLDEALGGRRFDVVVLGDVLEHLLDPLPVLRASRGLLAPGGSVCISVPNVAHGAVRLSLLAGRWEYRPLGLLDDTHVRFFTRDGLDRLLRAAGLAAADLRRTRAGLFETELELRPQDVDPELARRLAADDEATTYQFVLRAVPDDAEWSVSRLHDRLESTSAELRAVRAELESERVRATAAEDRADAAGREVAELRAQAERDAVLAESTADAEAARDAAAQEAHRWREEAQALRTTRTYRLASPVRALYGALRRGT